LAPIASDSAISPRSLASQTGLLDGDRDHDGGLSNPVRLLAEAADESNPGSPDRITRPSPSLPAVPPQYTLPETLMALLHEGPVNYHVSSLHISDEYLAGGLEKLLSDTAHRKLSEDDKGFFKPARREVKRDLGASYDPLDLALVTLKEVRVFFASFFSKLHPVMPVLDPALHTFECEERSL